jgi:hypothetical protein
MRKIDAVVLLIVLLAFGGMLYIRHAVPPQEPRFIYSNTIEHHHDTINKLRLKYTVLRRTDTLISEKYETLYIVLRGDTSCRATRRLLAMHRQLDSVGNKPIFIEGSGGTGAIKNVSRVP